LILQALARISLAPEFDGYLFQSLPITLSKPEEKA